MDAAPEPPACVIHQPYNLRIQAGDLFCYNGRLVKIEQLEQQLTAEKEKGIDTPLLIDVGKGVTYQAMVKFMDLARRSGRTKIGFVSGPNGKP